MPAVFVHGVPDTRDVWNRVISNLDRSDVLTLDLPGFGRPLGEGFSATKEEYVEWLLDELSKVDEPIDLVAHDWGARLSIRAISLQPGIVRTWAVGAAGFDAEYEWHDLAKRWQTPGVGEQIMESFTPDAVREARIGVGVPADYAAVAATRMDGTMKQAILNLYRSAVNVGTEWQDDLRNITAPGLVIFGEKDPYVSPKFGARLAER